MAIENTSFPTDSSTRWLFRIPTSVEDANIPQHTTLPFKYWIHNDRVIRELTEAEYRNYKEGDHELFSEVGMVECIKRVDRKRPGERIFIWRE